jgi:hypothetical protein
MWALLPKRKQGLYFKLMRFIFIFLLITSVAVGQKVQQVDVLIYGSNVAAQIAAHAAKSAGKKTLLIVPVGEETLIASTSMNRQAIKGLAWDFYRKLGQEQGQFDAFQANEGQKKRAIDAYHKQSEYLVWEGMTLQHVDKNDSQLLQLSFKDQSGLRLVKAKQVIDCSLPATLLEKTGYQVISQIDDDGMGGTIKQVQKPVPVYANLQAPVFMLKQPNEAEAIVASQTAVIRAMDAIQKGIDVRVVKEEDVQRYFTFNPWMDGSRPDVLIDDASHPLMEIIGPWKKVSDQENGFGQGYLSTFSDDDLGSRVRFNSRSLLKGVYHAYYFIPKSMGNMSIPMDVYVGRTKYPVALKLNQGTIGWQSLGTFTFSDPATADILISTKNAKGLILADAVLWVPQK